MARVLVIALVLLVPAGGASAHVDQPAHRSGSPLAVVHGARAAARISVASSLERQLADAVNAERVRHGLAPLRINRLLAGAARGHSTSMAEHGYFDHDAFGGAPFWQRIRAAYPALPGRVWRAGENLAWAAPDLSASQAVEMWLSSPGHRKNLLAPSWREIGIGGVHAAAAPGVFDGLDVTIVTADFGAR